MRRIAIVGGGQAGLQLGFGLLADGHEVTLLSDRTAAETLGGRIVASHVMQDYAQQLERDLGLNLWEREIEACGAGRLGGVHLDLCPPGGQIALTMEGRWPRPACAMDTRLKFAGWMDEFERRGGLLRHEAVTVARLEQLAESNDLVCVASGKGEISGLFATDEARSRYDAPQRNLALFVLTGMQPRSEVMDEPVQFAFFPGEGEFFWCSFFHKSKVPSHVVLFEPRPGGSMDRFGAAADGDALLQIAKEVVHDFAPWEDETFRNVRLADPLGWAKGAIRPLVRHPVARLASGRNVLALGDTAILNDPIAGQGGNCASKAADWLRRAIADREDRALDRDWMQEQFDGFWERHGRWMTQINTLLLEPLEAPGQQLLGAASQHAPVADAFVTAFNDPHELWPWIEDLDQTNARITQLLGGAAQEPVVA